MLFNFYLVLASPELNSELFTCLFFCGYGDETHLTDADLYSASEFQCFHELLIRE